MWISHIHDGFKHLLYKDGQKMCEGMKTNIYLYHIPYKSLKAFFGAGILVKEWIEENIGYVWQTTFFFFSEKITLKYFTFYIISIIF